MRTLLHRRAALVGLVVGVPLSVGFLWLAARNADLHEVQAVLSEADVGLIALAVAAIAGVYLGQAVRWRAIARTPTISTARFGEWVVSGVAVIVLAVWAMSRQRGGKDHGLRRLDALPSPSSGD